MFSTDNFTIDTRSLAVLRVALGAAVVADVISRSRNFHFFYTDRGVVTQEIVREIAPPRLFSLHQISAEPLFVAALFVATALVGVMLALGYKTRLSTFLAFLLVISIDHANPFVLSVADGLFRLLLFWSLFLPLGERYSVDAVKTGSTSRDNVTSLGSALILFQMVSVYSVNAAHKIRGGEWWLGEAAVLMIGRDEMTFLLGDHLRTFPQMVQVGGMLWFYLLVTSPLLLVLRGRKRYLFAGVFAGVHLGLAMSLRVGALLWLGAAGLLLFCQTEFWNDLRTLSEGNRLPASDIQKRWNDLRAQGVDYASRTPYPRFRIEGQRKWKPIVHSTALFLMGLTVILVLLYILAVQVALTPAAVLTDAEIDRGEAVKHTVEESKFIQSVAVLARNVGLTQQEWRMFATAANMDKYYVYPAETTDGEVLDVRNDRELSFERPYEELHRQHGTYRERFYRSFLTAVRWTEETDMLHERKAEYLCDRYERQGTPLTHVNMYVVYEEITRDTIDSPESRPRAAMELYRYGCGGRNAETVASPPFQEIRQPDTPVQR